MNKDEFLINVFTDTIQKSVTTYKEDTEELINATKVYTEEFLHSLVLEPVGTNNKVEFYSCGTTIAAKKLAKLGTVAILNFADDQKPGGWPEFGARTQEETLCRVSNLLPALKSRHCNNYYYALNAKFNGLATDNLIYSPRVKVFKDEQAYNDITPFEMDVITCPAPKIYLEDDEAYNIYVSRLDGVLKSAIIHGTDSIVLGAWGCGAFRQDPYIIAKAFARVANKYGREFKHIAFAIIPTPDWNISYNYQVFKEVFDKEYDGEIVEIK